MQEAFVRIRLCLQKGSAGGDTAAIVYCITQCPNSLPNCSAYNHFLVLCTQSGNECMLSRVLNLWTTVAHCFRMCHQVSDDHDFTGPCKVAVRTKRKLGQWHPGCEAGRKLAHSVAI